MEHALNVRCHTTMTLCITLQDCLKCNAKGRVACPPCDSYGQIRCYISLTISWKANTSEHIVEKSSLPGDLIRQVSGQVVYEEEGARIAPLLQFSDPTICLASAQLVLNHNRQWPDQRILAQVLLSTIHYHLSFHLVNCHFLVTLFNALRYFKLG